MLRDFGQLLNICENVGEVLIVLELLEHPLQLDRLGQHIVLSRREVKVLSSELVKY